MNKSLSPMCNIDPLLCQCHCCGNVFVSSDFMRCPICNSGNYKHIPISNHPGFNFSWLSSHGFPHIKEQLEADVCVE